MRKLIGGESGMGVAVGVGGTGVLLGERVAVERTGVGVGSSSSSEPSVGSAVPVAVSSLRSSSSSPPEQAA
jgi:hypothetical protein